MLILSALGCATQAVLIDDTPVGPGSGWVDDVPVGTDPDDPEPFDPTPWEGATFRITSPAAGALVPLGSPVTWEAELRGADGSPLQADRITWSSSLDPAWDGLGASFVDGSLAPGLHEITAVATLPTGDVHVHTLGGVRVQHPLTGAWSGLFSATGDFGDFQFTCSGSSTLSIDARGETAVGNGACVASLVIFDLPLDFVFDLEVDPATGAMQGQAGTVLFGPIVYDFPATGQAAPNGIQLAWGGNVLLLNFSVSATLSATRIGLDPL